MGDILEAQIQCRKSDFHLNMSETSQQNSSQKVSNPFIAACWQSVLIVLILALASLLSVPAVKASPQQV